MTPSLKSVSALNGLRVIIALYGYYRPGNKIKYIFPHLDAGARCWWQPMLHHDVQDVRRRIALRRDVEVVACWKSGTDIFTPTLHHHTQS